MLGKMLETKTGFSANTLHPLKTFTDAIKKGDLRAAEQQKSAILKSRLILEKVLVTYKGKRISMKDR